MQKQSTRWRPSVTARGRVRVLQERGPSLRQVFVLHFEQRLTVSLADAFSNLRRVIIARCQQTPPIHHPP